VRELKNAIERAVVIARGDVVTPADLPERVRKAAPPPEEASGAGAPQARTSTEIPAALEESASDADYKERVRAFTQRYETQLIVDALRRAGGSQTKAAEDLKIPVRTLAHKMKELGIKKTFE
jgi:DNA-binding NtrC family response regulator